MEALKRRTIFLILFCALLTASLVGGISIMTANGILRQQSDEALQLRCQNSSMELNTTLGSIRRSVEVLYNQSYQAMGEDRALLHDPAAARAHSRYMYNILLAQAQNTSGCIAAYIRYNPDLGEDGLFLVRDFSDRFVSYEVTDIRKYAPDDREHVGWYYEPIRAGHGIWMAPYYNKNLQKYLISYVMPIVVEQQVVGIVGMDIEFSYLEQLVRNISVYSTGYASLVYKDCVIVHRDFPLYGRLSEIDMEHGTELRLVVDHLSVAEDGTTEYVYAGEKKKCASTKLDNGMRLLLCASQDEIYEASHALLLKLGAVIFCAVVLMAVLVHWGVGKLVQLATEDPLTHLPNRSQVMEYYSGLQSESSSYALFLLDIDGFKKINDEHGHDVGDEALCQIADVLRQFAVKKVFCARWGGDEFIGILPAADLIELMEELRRRIAQHRDARYGQLTASIGALLIQQDQVPFAEALKRADAAMYQSKVDGRNRITIVHGL